MVRKRGNSGQYVESVTHEGVLDVFDRVEGPVITSADVAEALDCSSDAARKKLTELYEAGQIDRRKTAGRLIYWRLDGGDDGEEAESLADRMNGFGMFADNDEFVEEVERVRKEMDEDFEERQRDLFGN